MEYEKQTEKVYDDQLESASFSDEHRLAEEKRLVRKLDKRIMPIACLLYLFACLSPAFVSLYDPQSLR